ncbi:MAG: glycosyltransferase [Acidobacteria bacterium]|nr:glycosyltransferase [Acidobacteriota bacterium]
MSPAGVGVVIVTYQSAGVIERCLRSLRGVEQAVVVDNASTDHSATVARNTLLARVIANETNRGFAAAVNQGVAALKTPLILVLNPDVELQAGFEESAPIVREALRPEVGLVGGRLEDEDGAYQEGFGVRALPTPGALLAEALLLNRVWPGNPWNRRYRCVGFDPSAAQDCEQPAGAFLLFRREIFERMGGFDEDFYPLWFEDVDFCWRIRAAGYRIRYEPTARGRHLGAHSIGSLSAANRHKAWYGNLLRFADKHFSTAENLALRAAATVGLAVRGIGRGLTAGGIQEGRACFHAIRTVWSRPHSFSRDAGGAFERTRAA